MTKNAQHGQPWFTSSTPSAPTALEVYEAQEALPSEPVHRMGFASFYATKRFETLEGNYFYTFQGPDRRLVVNVVLDEDRDQHGDKDYTTRVGDRELNSNSLGELAEALWDAYVK